MPKGVPRTAGHCPICGGKYRRWEDHHCRRASLSAIDAANTRAWNEEMGWKDYGEPLYRRGFAQRLAMLDELNTMDR